MVGHYLFEHDGPVCGLWAELELVLEAEVGDIVRFDVTETLSEVN